MKKTIITAAVMAFLMGGFCTTVSAMETKSSARTEIVAGDDWDKVLNEYEKYVDQYIKTYKKAMKGDMSAMSEYVKLAEKAQELSEKIDKAKGCPMGQPSICRAITPGSSAERYPQCKVRELPDRTEWKQSERPYRR